MSKYDALRAMREGQPAIQHSIVRMVCTGCGSEANASCNCGKAYVPKGVRAAEAIAADPNKSDRAIAAEIGVSHTTVQEARKATGNHLPVDERTGLDGKTRKLPEPALAKPADLNADAIALVNKLAQVLRRMDQPDRLRVRTFALQAMADAALAEDVEYF
jgi:hypothetical protein